MQKIPASLQGILWSKSVSNLDFEKDKAYIIHHILMYGSLADIRWLFQFYSPSEIRKTFATIPYKIYTKPAFHFIKNLILDLQNDTLDSRKYVKTLS